MSDTEEKRLLLKSAHLKGFKSIEDLTVEFKPGLNILIGKNGSGKSNLLEFLNAAFSVNSDDEIAYSFAALDYVSGTTSFTVSRERNRFKRQQPKLEIAEDYVIKVKSNEFTVYDSANSGLSYPEMFQPLLEEITGSIFKPNSTQVFPYLKQQLQPVLLEFDIPAVINFVSTAGTLHMPKDSSLPWEWPKTPSFLDGSLWNLELGYQSSDFLLENGRDVVIRSFKLSEAIVFNLNLFTPIKDLRLNEGFSIYETDKGVIIDNLRIDFLVNDNWVPWSYLSDGTKRLFYIITEVTHKKDGLILIEEPELGVHPSQFHLLMQFLKQESENKQIVISTHSPKALDILQHDELDHIMIARYDKEKGTQISRMDDQKIDKAQNYMKELFLSDFWLLSDLEEDD